MSVSVLFVCLGNICRSPIADGVLRHRAASAMIDVVVDSAGTGDWHLGHPPDRRAQSIALQNGVDISGLRARQVTAGDFDTFDHIIAMDHRNLADLMALRPAGSRAKLSLLLDHADGIGLHDVPDPYCGSDDDFAETYRLVETGVRGLLGGFAARS